MFPTTMPDDPAALAAILAFGYFLGVPIGIIAAGRIMTGHYGEPGRVYFLTMFATIASIFIGVSVSAVSPILYWLSLLLIPPIVGTLSFKTRMQPDPEDQGPKHDHGIRID